MKKIIALMLMMLSLSATVNASQNESNIQCSVDLKTDTVTITGEFGAENAEAGCNLLILNPGYSVQDLPDSEFKGIQKQAETKLSDKGVLELKFPINETDIQASGFCKIYVKLQSGSVSSSGVKEGEFFYSKDDDIIRAIKDLNLCRELSDAEVKDKIEQYKNILSYNFAPYEAIDKTALAQRLKSDTAPVFSETDYSEVQSWMKLQSIIEAFNQGKSEAVYKGDTILYDEYTSLSAIDTEKNISVFKLYTTELNSIGKSNVRNAITGKNIQNAEDLKKEFAKAVTVEAVRNNSKSGYGHISSVLTSNAGYVGLDLSKYKSSAAADKSILNANASDITALQTAINNSGFVTQGSGSGGGGSSSSGGGASSGGSGSGSVSFIKGNGQETVSSPLEDYKTTNSVTDMEDVKWGVEAVEFLIEKGVISKPEDGKFRPNDSITREEFVKLAVTAFNISIDGEKSGFNDVGENDWSFEYIYAAKNAGIINGISDGYFGKKDCLSRQDMAVILKRCCDYKGITLSQESDSISFTDSAEISGYAGDAVQAFAKSGIINGMEDGSYRPMEECTRVQCAKVIYLIIKE